MEQRVSDGWLRRIVKGAGRPSCAERALAADLVLARAEIVRLRAAGQRLIGAVEACAVAGRGGPAVNWDAADQSQDAMRDALRPQAEAPKYEYRTTTGQRKAWDGDPDLSKEGWEEYQEWERFDYHEERYWRRPQAEARHPEKP